MQKTLEIPIEYKRLFDTDWREAAVYGGRYSLKSHTVARVLLARARAKKTRVACFREFQNSIADSSHQLLSDLIKMYGLTDFRITDKTIINTINGSDFLFKGLHHNEQSVKSTEGIDIAWIEEAQTVSTPSLEVLTPTVRKPGSQLIYTYNRLLEEDPVHVRLVMEGRPNTLIINANYDIAEKYGWMPDVVKQEIESDKKNRPGLYKHKWLGEPVNQDAKIYNDWNIIDEIPHEAQIVRRGLDFGFSNDPAAIVDVYRYNGGYIVTERLYRKGMHNNELASFLQNLDKANTVIMADSAEPKSVSEISLYNLPIVAVTKKGIAGKSYLKHSIDYVQQQRISMTKSSINLIKEYRNYIWMTDKDGKIINEPTPGNDHALDALRYAFDGLRPQEDEDMVGSSSGNIKTLWY
jgi:PBSX family phage terminase large subunit